MLQGSYNFNSIPLAYECDICSGTGKRPEGAMAELAIEHGYYGGPTVKGTCYFCSGHGHLVTEQGLELLMFARKFMDANIATQKVTFSRSLKKMPEPTGGKSE